MPPELYLLTDESFMDQDAEPPRRPSRSRDRAGLDVRRRGTGFKGTFQVEIDNLPDEGPIGHVVVRFQLTVLRSG